MFNNVQVVKGVGDARRLLQHLAILPDVVEVAKNVSDEQLEERSVPAQLFIRATLLWDGRPRENPDEAYIETLMQASKFLMTCVEYAHTMLDAYSHIARLPSGVKGVVATVRGGMLCNG